VIAGASSQNDIRLLRLEVIAECMALVEMHARHAIDHAVMNDGGPALDYSLRCVVAAVKAAVKTRREMLPKPSQADREAA
jgi:hypothetical protein